MNDIKNKVEEKIKVYSNDEYLDGYIKNEYLLEDGNAKIMMKFDDKNELFDSRTFGNQLNLKESIYEYIDNKSEMLNNDINIHLHIVCSNLDKEEKNRIEHVIIEHYAIELYKIQKEFKRYKTKMYKLILVGILFFALYAIVALNVSSMFLIEVFSFLFSFTLWQAFETSIYTLNDIKLTREAITQKIVMDIKFIAPDDAF